MPWYIVTGVLPGEDGGAPRPGPRPVWGPHATEADARRVALRVPGTYVVEAAGEQDAIRAAFREAGLPAPAEAVGSQ